MAYNIFERWPFTSFQNLNLDWILSNMKEAVDKANEASETVGQFDDRISKNTQDIADLTEDINNKPEPMMIDVNTNLQVLYKTLPITGGEIYNAMVVNRYLPFVRYRDEIYMVDSIFTDSAARDVIRFALLYAPDLGSTYIKRLDIIFTGNTAAYSIKTISGGESADDVLEIRVTANGGTYQTNTAYSQISAAASRGYFIYLRLVDGSDNTLYTTGLMSFDNNAYTFINPDSFLRGGQMYAIVINSNNEVYNLLGPQYLTTDAFAEYLPRLLPVVSSADNGKSLRVVEGAWEAANYAPATPRVVMASTDTAATIEPNKLYVFPEMASLAITLATITDNSIVNEFHFIFTSGATATTLSIPATVNQPDGFTVEANHVYEVSILEGAMTAQGWAVTA